MNQILFNKLQNYVKRTSVSQLANVKSKILIKELGISKAEVQAFMQDMHSNRLVEYKFNYKCSDCEEPITIYENEYASGKLNECRNCGKEQLIEEMINAGEVLYTFNKKEIINYSANIKKSNVSLLERPLIVGDGKVIEIKPKKRIKRDVIE